MSIDFYISPESRSAVQGQQDTVVDVELGDIEFGIQGIG